MESKGIAEGLWAVMKCVGITYFGKLRDSSKAAPSENGTVHLTECYELVVQYNRTPDGLLRDSFLLFTGVDTAPCPTQVKYQMLQWVDEKEKDDQDTLNRLLAEMRQQTIEMRAKRSGITLEKKIPSGLDLGRGKRG